MSSDLLAPSDTFVHRHLGPREDDLAAMLAVVGSESLEALVDETIPPSIRIPRPLQLDAPVPEGQLLAQLKSWVSENEVFNSYIGMGYYDTIVPGVILRNIMENPGWYTQYTPYQAEIAQGRMEALVNFQTMVADLTGLPLANASLLDEGTAAAEAMAMAMNVARGKKKGFFVADDCHPQTIAVVRTRAVPLGIDLHVGKVDDIDFAGMDLFGVLVQYPNTWGTLNDYSALADACHDNKALLAVATDLLALTLLKPPGEWGADIAIGSSQRFGVPMGFGGPHAGFMSTHDKLARKMPGRIIGVSKDADGHPAYRLALQTREQHIRRDKATSNICTAQVLLAVMAGMYGVYHGPEGLKTIARRVHGLTRILAAGLRELGFDLGSDDWFDTVTVTGVDASSTHEEARAQRMNLRPVSDSIVGVSLDETTTIADVDALLAVFAAQTDAAAPTVAGLRQTHSYELRSKWERTSEFMTHPTFHLYRSEHEMLRYLFRLQNKDLSLAHSMIALGSCTMKLNGTSEMIPVTWPEIGGLHPFAPADQTRGYDRMFRSLEGWLAEITGLPAVSLQPNAGSQGEYAGLLAIRGWHRANGDTERNICLIPTSAHGTNPASAVTAGFKVVVVACDDAGNIDLADLRAKTEQHAANLGALMVTYPSTHGVFEEAIQTICDLVHEHGGQVYVDGANMNAQVGLCRPGDYGADVIHLNLHKTFCIPHGGGGPGMGPICSKEHLRAHLPGHPVTGLSHGGETGPVSAAPYGSPSILPISWMYIGLMGGEGLTKASQVAILNANYMAKRLEGHYDIVYTGRGGRVAHEFIMDCRGFKSSAGISVDDIAKRLMDFGFHAPTMSWPVTGTLMVEPTESESREELDRFIDAMITIRAEIQAIEDGTSDADDNALRHAPHTAASVSGDAWTHPYPREQAAWPLPWVRDRKFWPSVRRVDNAYGDRNLMCTCPPLDAYED
ncbi:MAG: aminomethyl-transferring glycine dehydrogenase [Deltaproteobacteria bacterium]|nr:aminomethyl-transferring glycine dehydrogenase [Deltaproteobacteria bacterium]